MKAGKIIPSTVRRSHSSPNAPATAIGVLSKTLNGNDQLSYSAARIRKTNSSETPKMTEVGMPSRAFCSCRDMPM